MNPTNTNAPAETAPAPLPESVGIVRFPAEVSLLRGSCEQRARERRADKTFLGCVTMVCDSHETLRSQLATMTAQRDELLEAAKASEQCIVDFLEIYKNGGSMLVMDEAVKSLKTDALAKARTAIAKATSSPSLELKAATLTIYLTLKEAQLLYGDGELADELGERLYVTAQRHHESKFAFDVSHAEFEILRDAGESVGVVVEAVR